MKKIEIESTIRNCNKKLIFYFILNIVKRNVELIKNNFL